jgi:hypothetical protein
LRTPATLALVSQRFRKFANDDEVWRRICAGRWDLIPQNKDLAKNNFLPRHIASEDEDSTQRLFWREYYYLREASEAELEALMSLQTEIGISPVGMAPAEEAPIPKSRFGALKKKAPVKKGLPLSGSAISIKNLFDMIKLADSTAQDQLASREEEGPSTSTEKAHTLAFAQFAMELLAHATDPSTLAAASKSEQAELAQRFSGFPEQTAIIALTPDLSKDSNALRKVIRLTMFA